MNSRTTKYRSIKRKRLACAVALCFLASPVLCAEIYKWKDADGKTHISDRPPPDRAAERVQIRVYNAPADVPSAGTEQAAPRVVMLFTTWCPVCRRARSWLQQKGIPFTEYDVDKNDTGKSEYRRLNGQGVPIILVRDQRMDGFSAARLEAMLRAAK